MLKRVIEFVICETKSITVLDGIHEHEHDLGLERTRDGEKKCKILNDAWNVNMGYD